MKRFLLLVIFLAGCSSYTAPTPQPSQAPDGGIRAVRLVKANWYDMTCFISSDVLQHKVCYPTLVLVQDYVSGQNLDIDQYIQSGVEPK